jgi:response regulator RpfG family c-di-GMP phosphodiesterase
MSAKTALIDPSWLRILIVDEEQIVLTLLRDHLQPEGFHVTTMDSPSQALELLQRESFSVILADHEMPEMSGLDLLGKVQEQHPSISRLLLTSGMSLNSLGDAIKSGHIYRYIAKPWLREELVVTVRNAGELHRLLTENNSLHSRHELLRKKWARLADTHPEAGEIKENPTHGTGAESGATASGPDPVLVWADGLSLEDVDLAVESFIKMLHTYHPNLGNSAIRAQAMIRTLGEVLELSPNDLKNLLRAAALHDISLVRIDRGIVRRWLRSPEKCSEEELILIQRHPVETQEILNFCPVFKEAGEIIRSHHENWDGTGYPDGLKGEMIPWLSRLLSAVLVFCAKHSGAGQALNEMRAHTETMFDKNALEAVAKAAPLTKMPRGERELLLIELQPGMVLARDIYNANGFLLLPKGKELTNAWTNKIATINRVTPLDPLALVYS